MSLKESPAEIEEAMVDRREKDCVLFWYMYD